VAAADRLVARDAEGERERVSEREREREREREKGTVESRHKG